MRTPLLLGALAVACVSLAVPRPAQAQEEAQEKAPAPAAAEPPAVSGLVYLGLNDQGAEEWYRVRDGGVVVRVPGGDYMKRPYEGWVAEDDPSPVPVASFFIDKTEVTNAQYVRFLETREDVVGLLHAGVPGIERGPDGWRASAGLEQHPVTAATGDGAVAFAAWVGGRMPQPNEWEKAAGGVEGRLFPWGDEQPDATRANFGRPKPRGTLPVGSFAAGASPYGCLDMAGNAYERVEMRLRGGGTSPVMIKGGSWVSAHPLNLRVLDLCVQPMNVADRSVGLRCVMDDLQPDRATRTAAAPAKLRLATSFAAAVAEARERRVPMLVALFHETCGQSDRTREQLFRDPRFIAYCNEHAVVIVGHHPSHSEDAPHPANADGSCPLYPGVSCRQHMTMYAESLKVVKTFATSPGNFGLHPDKVEGSSEDAIVIPERALPKWGNAVDEYIARLEEARKLIAGDGE